MTEPVACEWSGKIARMWLQGGRKQSLTKAANERAKATTMLKGLLITGALLLASDHSFAQAPGPAQCQQVRDAVSQYGYAAARHHALVTYGPDAVRAGDRCLGKHYGTSSRAHYRGASRKHYQTHYKKHDRARSPS
jgi:hypothetical protein